jgi:16S rRNA (guanine527-N7)-methyltransferase
LIHTAKPGGGPPSGIPAHPLLQHIPKETLERLKIYEARLRKWQRVINLVAPSTLDALWVRHFADSLQVSDAAPDARRWLDLGSGAGFPGLVTAIRYADDPNAAVHLIESDQRKCAFMQGVSRETGAAVLIHCGRIEKILPGLDAPIDAISARALAPLPVLLGYAEKYVETGAIGVFSKGQQAEAELTDSHLTDRFLITTLASRTSDSGKLVVVRRRRDSD